MCVIIFFLRHNFDDEFFSIPEKRACNVSPIVRSTSLAMPISYIM
jgi:hypothetical protein